MAGIEEGWVEDLKRVWEVYYDGDFMVTYYKDCEALVKLLMKHGLLPQKKLC